MKNIKTLTTVRSIRSDLARRVESDFIPVRWVLIPLFDLGIERIQSLKFELLSAAIYSEPLVTFCENRIIAKGLNIAWLIFL
jgi:hypothetical protein